MSASRNMSNQSVFRIILGMLGILGALVRLYYMRRVSESGQKISIKREEGLRMASLWSFTALGWIAGLLYVIAPQRMRWAALPLPTWSRWIGVGLGIVSLPSFLWTHRALGKNWSATLEIKEQHTLVTSGPYRWVRHPMYTTIFVQALASFLVSANWVIGMAGLGTNLMVAARVADEEALMIDEFGDQYRAYMRRTGRFLPPLGRAEESGNEVDIPVPG